MIVVNYIQSYEMVKALEASGLSLREIYGNDRIDMWSRLPDDATAEKVTEYWKRMANVSVNGASGIVTLKIRAFTANDSANLIQRVMSASEIIVNEVNARIWKDVINTADENLKHSASQLEDARKAVADARNKNSLLSVESSADLINGLISNLEAERLKLQGRMDSQPSAISASAPQMKVLTRRIDSLENQISNLKGQLAGTQSVGNLPNLADISQQLSQLQTVQNLAEVQFAASTKALEQVRFTSRQQLMYLESFVAPRVPDAATYPKSLLFFVITVICSVGIWGSAIGLAYLLRRRLSN
ncbi:capsule biosynthesis protein [Agrobacterium rosae]|uniref:capsule biosynthesis protein n=1 Tax=Agrobacterium rosae TaxID=1972867 RepID=UPI003BA28E71